MNIQELVDGIEAGEIDAEQIGWQILDAKGQVIDSGPVSFAELTAESLEQLNQEG